uniref:Small ribosomal subunit protein uS3m n=1 Tax=Cantharellus lutescens TaxID=104198 RepID=A0A2S0S4E9_9AGAM|nr:ribosomal protein S3 [Cantharellus lutescens]AWA82222.1 ribosomal protein S3 [Cantharellus lutescens]
MLQNLIQKLSSTDFKLTNSIIKDKNMIFYYNMQNNLKYTNLKLKLSTILNAYFKHFGYLISEPVINVTPKKLNIHIFYYKKDVVSQNFINQRYQQIYSNILRRSIKNRLSKANLVKNLTSVNSNSLSSNSLNNPTLYATSLPLTLKNKQINSIKFKAERLANKLIKRVNFNSYNGLLNTYYLNSLGFLLSHLLQTHVEVELVRLTYPYHESKILSELVGINGKTLSYSRIKYLLLNKSKILTPVTYIFNNKIINSISSITPNSILNKKNDDDLFKQNLFNNRLSDNKNLTKSYESNEYIHYNKELLTYLTGIKLKISGRLAKQRVVPKRTVKTAYKGGISDNKYNIVESSTFTHKNKKGAFSIRIWLSHGKIS